jgi:hypothetical protein
MTAVQEVYDFLGAGDNVTLIVRDGAHANQDRDLPYIIAVMDKVFGRTDQVEVRQLDSLASPGGSAAIDGSGVIYPAKTYPTVAALSAVPYEIDSAYQQWSRPGKYTLWSETQYLTEGFVNSITVHTDAPKVQLTLPDGSILTEKVRDGTAVLNLTAAQAMTGRYTLETAGKKMDNKTVYLQGFDLANALRHGLGLTSGSPDGMNVGFTSKLTDRDAMEVSVTSGGKTTVLEAGYIDGSSPVYLETFGVSLKQQYIPVGPFTLTLKNLRLEALPGCTFELTVDLIGIKQSNTYAGGAMEGRALSAQNEKPTWNSTDLKNGPMPEWPVYPESTKDTGARPDAVPTVSAFDTAIAVGAYDGKSVTLTFSEPVNTREFGVGFDKVSSWTTDWASDAKSVTLRFDQPVSGDVSLYLFRLVDIQNNMIPAPQAFTLSVK